MEEKKDKVIIIGEIGINHGGDIRLAKKLIDVAVIAGCDAVKFQKRDINSVYSKEVLDSYRASKWGVTTKEQKMGLEFEKEEYDEIDRYCKEKRIDWFASSWDLRSQEFLRQYNLKYNKVASAMLTVFPLLEKIAEEKKYTFISTGMSTMKEIENAVEIFKKYNCPFELMHCNSSYPQKNEESNLKMIETLRNKFNCKVGYSGHERGLQISLAAAAMGVSSIERHIVDDRTREGSDVSNSLESEGLIKLVRDIRIIERSMGDGVKKIFDSEVPIREKLIPYWYKKMLRNEK